MRENPTVGSIIELISQSEGGSHNISKRSPSIDKQRIYTFNIAIVMTALASLIMMAISITKNNEQK
jgi:hypothetical protein